MFCSQCGCLMDRKATYCTNCGFKLKNAIPEVKDVTKHTSVYEGAVNAKNSCVWISFFLILVGIIIYFVGCILSLQLHFLFHIIAVIGGLIILVSVNELIAMSKYPPRKK